MTIVMVVCMNGLSSDAIMACSSVYVDNSYNG